LDLPSARKTGLGIGPAAVIVLVVTEMVSVTMLSSGMTRDDVVVEPAIRAHLRAGRARVLVMLQVGESGDDEQRADAIARAQDSILSRLLGPMPLWCGDTHPSPRSPARLMRLHCAVSKGGLTLWLA
jgi:hypothetical protein